MDNFYAHWSRISDSSSFEPKWVTPSGPGIPKLDWIFSSISRLALINIDQFGPVLHVHQMDVSLGPMFML